MNEKALNSKCPFCDGMLEITNLHCVDCHTQLSTTIEVPKFFHLPTDLQEFVLIFLRCRGNIREVEKVLGISYPTVCKRLELVNERLGQGTEDAGGKSLASGTTREDILSQVEAGTLSAREASKLLKKKLS